MRLSFQDWPRSQERWGSFSRIGSGYILGDPKKLNIEICHLALQQTNKLVHKETFYCDDRNKMRLSQHGQN